MRVTRPIVGLDPSLSGLAIAVSGGEIQELKTRPSGREVHARLCRFELLTAAVAEELPQRSIVFIEGYSFGSKGSSGVTLGEFGGVLRLSLIRLRHTLVEVAPATLKKFATGKGNAKKPAVVSALTKRFGEVFDTDNQADAFGLMKLGEYALGALDSADLTKPQRAAVDAIVLPPTLSLVAGGASPAAPSEGTAGDEGSLGGTAA